MTAFSSLLRTGKKSALLELRLVGETAYANHCLSQVTELGLFYGEQLIGSGVIIVDQHCGATISVQIDPK